MSESIAIVGLACEFPEASSPRELWLNILARRRSFRRIPAARLCLDDYASPDPSDPDATYLTRAAVIDGWELDRARFRISPETHRATDTAHWLALDVATRALEDAGFRDGVGLPRETTGVIVGNTLTGEFSRADQLRLRWPYVRRILDATLGAQAPRQLGEEERTMLLASIESAFKAPLAPQGEDSLAGALSNTIAGRICNHHDLKGGGFTVDGACSSSLLAVVEACSRLAAGELDVALAGGVDLSLDPFELVGFARLGALAKCEMRVFDERPTGFLPGEGCGFVVLMRERDALASNSRILARIRGWGISSDGSGGLTRPEASGQVLALERACRRAGFGAETVTYFEAHGTGTAAGDAAEVEALTSVRRRGRSTRPAWVGSIKANIGHAKAAAGIAGLIRATMALHRRIIPPTTGCHDPRPEVRGGNAMLEIARTALPWPGDRPLRAGVSAMGFGGINAHVVLDADGLGETPDITEDEARSMRTPQDAELFVLAAPDAASLLALVERAARAAPHLSDGALVDLSAELWRTVGAGPARAALVASTVDELVQGLAMMAQWIREGRPGEPGRADALVRFEPASTRVGFLFSGQGAPVRLSAGLLGERFGSLRTSHARLETAAGHEPHDARVVQAACVAASIGALALLRELGVEAELAVGHSLGELTALHWAGALTEEALWRVVLARGEALAALDGGAMAAILAPAEDAERLLEGGAVIACFNGPREVVVSGDASSIRSVMSRARERGITAMALSVTHAFHSPLVEAAGPALAQALAAEAMGAPTRRVLSCVSGDEITSEDCLRDLIVRHLTSPVRFAEMVSRASREVDLFVEVGAGDILSRLARGIGRTPSFSLDVGGQSVRGLLQVAASLFVRSAPVRLEVLLGQRHCKALSIDTKLEFLANPCEMAPAATRAPVLAKPESRSGLGVEARRTLEGGSDSAVGAPPLAVVTDVVAAHLGLPREDVAPGLRLLADLHLSSLTAARLIAEAARRLGVPPLSPLELVSATVGEVATVLQGLASSGDAARQDRLAGEPQGVDAWVRALEVVLVDVPTPPALPGPGVGGSWRIVAPAGGGIRGLADSLERDAPGGGVAVLLAGGTRADESKVLLESARMFMQGAGRTRFLIVQEGKVASAMARGIHAEMAPRATCLVSVPPNDPRALGWIAAEARSATGFREVHYDAEGRRLEPRVRPLGASDRVKLDPPPGPGDVLLVTGGGKGIAAECALALARDSGVRLALLSRSAPQDDAALAANMARFEREGVVAVHAVADVTDRAATQRAIRDLQAALGPVTMVLHAAGLNVPAPLSSMDEAILDAALAPKVLGAQHVLEALDVGRLRSFLAFGSIIARVGLPGAAHYGFANEGLRHFVEELQARLPNCRCLCIEWSAWSGAGMAERLATLEPLARRGITAITVDAGVDHFTKLARAPPRTPSVIVTGRWGRSQALEMQSSELPLLRFIETPRVHYPGIELVVDVTLDPQSDPYLDDHVFEGERLFPAVMGLEAMAQMGLALGSGDEPPVLADVRFDRAITVPETGRVIRIAALAREDGDIDIAMRSQETGFRVDHFKGRCTTRSADVVRDAASTTRQSPEGEGSVAIDPCRDLYGGILFQGGRFRRVARYRSLSATECHVEITPAAPARWFSRYLPSRLVLGDPGARDALMHSIQACHPHASLLPLAIDTVVPLSKSEGAIRSVHSRETALIERGLQHDVVAFDGDSLPVETWTGLRLRVLDGPCPTAWPPALVGPLVERRLADLFPGVAGRAALVEDTDASTPILLAGLVGKGVEVHRRADGRLETIGGPAVSASHAMGLTLLFSAPGMAGCDLEPLAELDSREWTRLLGADHADLARRIAEVTGEARTVSATRAWCVLECLKKAGLALDTPLILRSVETDGWVALSAGAARVGCLVTRLRDRREPFVFSFLAGAVHAKS